MVPLLHIARVCFTQAGGFSPPALSAHYSQFTREIFAAPGIVSVPTSLRLADQIETPGERLFRTEGAWSLAREAGDRVLSLGGTDPTDKARTLVRFSPGQPPAVKAFCRDPGDHPLAYPVDQILLMYLLAARAGAIFHAAGFAFRGQGVAFLGRSRAGKTTISRFLLERPGWEPLSDDRVVVRAIGEEHLLFGTPWPGEAGLASNSCFPLRGLCFLRQAPENSLARLTPRATLTRLMPVCSVPWFDREYLLPALDFLGGLAAAVPAYELMFRKDTSLPDFLESRLLAGD